MTGRSVEHQPQRTVLPKFTWGLRKGKEIPCVDLWRILLNPNMIEPPVTHTFDNP